MHRHTRVGEPVRDNRPQFSVCRSNTVYRSFCLSLRTLQWHRRSCWYSWPVPAMRCVLPSVSLGVEPTVFDSENHRVSKHGAAWCLRPEIGFVDELVPHAVGSLVFLRQPIIFLYPSRIGLRYWLFCVAMPTAVQAMPAAIQPLPLAQQ